MKNKWKVAFLALLGIIVGLVGFFFLRATQQREVIQYDTQPIVQREGEPVLSINSDKEQINALIDFYLQNYQKDSDVEYHFQLENQAMLTGDFKVLGAPITFYLYFDPYVTDDGNVQLQADSLSIGTLDLPVKQVMKMIEKSFKFPKWIEFNPDEETVLVRLDQFRMENGLFVKAEKINLVDDDIQVSLYLPQDKEK
ncbi:YpmS family protein [Tetragenococcus koreensis]|nr:YpmS family protein [Tetragenococcus koreensis]MDN6278667.1 YpmS family protein [Lactococcus lactis]MCF1585477.1 YpmS family protein [Tetragenococcus koreensis]MCF1615031.1 YpmS family protein [Tetragenococcus koreensis]MCF1617273.1 YpmS family protein [Tetragenococcus koreensis]MCF1620187.1 YpmS family protein [Tetragenococcus koreensis]